MTPITPRSKNLAALSLHLYVPHLAAQVPYTMAKFAVQGKAAEAIYSSLNSDAKSMSKGSNIVVSLASGVVAGVVAAIISHPADTLLSKINKGGAGGSGSMMSRLINIASETGIVNLCTTGACAVSRPNPPLVAVAHHSLMSASVSRRRSGPTLHHDRHSDRGSVRRL